MANLLLKDVSKRYPGGNAPALERIDLEIRSGEFIVLVGPSGCGKSTLLRCVAGLESLSSGQIEIGNRRVDPLPPSERGIGMVFQDYALYPHMSVRENLEFGLKLKKHTAEEIRRRVACTSEMLGLSELLERKPAQLSGGQRQRVAIGRALVKEPSVLLLDEPLSNLDAQLRVQTRLEIASLHRRIGSTTIYVTHDQEEAMTLADRIVVLDRGRVQQFAEPLTLYHEPANRFVASFIGSPGMNFLERDDAALNVPKIAPRAREGQWTLGFRPEAWSLPREGRGAGGTLRLRLTLERMESLGHEIQIAARLGSKLIRLRKSGAEAAAVISKLETGRELEIEIPLSEIRWFEEGRYGRRLPESELPQSAA